MKRKFLLSLFFTLTAFIHPLSSSATDFSSFNSALDGSNEPITFEGEAKSPHEKFAYESKKFDWEGQKIFHGDCGADNISVVINPNGSGKLKSVTWTRETHSGDYWWWSIEGLDAQKVRLWKTQEHMGPRMDDGTPPPRYHNDFDFNFDASKYQGTTYLMLWKRC